MNKKQRLLFFFITIVLSNIGINLAHPVTPAFLQSLNLGDFVFGLAYAAMAFFNFSTSLTWGSLTSKFKISWLLLFTSVGYGIAQLLFGSATTVAQIVVARGLAGVFASAFSILPINYLISISSKEERMRNITIVSIIMAIASSLGYLMGGLLAEISIYFVFVFQTVWMMVVGIVFYLVFNHTNQPLSQQPLKLGDLNPFRIFGQAKQILHRYAAFVFIVIFFSWVAATLFDSSFNYYIKDVFDFPPKINGYIKALIGVLSLLINSFLTIRLLNTFDIKKVNRIFYVLLTMASSLVLFVSNPQLFVTFSFVYYTMNAMILPIQQNTVSSLYENQEDSNLAMGFYNAVKMLGGVGGSLVAGFAYEIRPLLPFVIATVIFALLMILNFRKEKSI